MGLLDEAIRDHLELKRLRGADPGEIAHQERAALDPVFPAEQPLAKEAVDAEEDALAAPQAPDALEEPLAAEDEPAASAPAAERVAGEAILVGEETAELDMQAVLAADADEPHDIVAEPAQDADPPAERSRGGDPAAADARGDGEFEWEMPGAGSDLPAEPGPGQERMSFE
jgi:hypothetical protein